MGIAWGAEPPRKKLDASIRLLCVHARETIIVAILGPLEGLQTHWVDGKTMACLGSQDCPWHDRPQTWKGYVAVLQLYDDKGKGLRRAPAPAVLVCSEEIGWTMKQTCRGEVMRVSRGGSKNNGPMRAEKSDLVLSGRLPEAFNVRPYVGRAMGISLA